MRICVFEDAAVARLEPLTRTRPAFDLRCGAATLLERQARCLGGEAAGALMRPEPVDLCRLECPALAVNDPAWLSTPGEGLVLVNARWLPRGPFTPAAGPEVGLVGDQVAYVALPAGGGRDLSWQALPGRLGGSKDAWPRRPAGGRLINYPWDPVERNALSLEQDYLPLPPGGAAAGAGRGALARS